MIKLPLMFRYTHETILISKDTDIFLLKARVMELKKQISDIGFTRNMVTGEFAKF